MRVLASAVASLATAVTGVIVAAVPAHGAAPCLSACTVTFAPGPQATWQVPAGLSDLTAEIAAGSGAANSQDAAGDSAGAGGTIVVDLGTSYNGQTLHLLVGKEGTLTFGGNRDDGPILASGGGGSYLAVPGRFVAVAGGGGGGGHFTNESTRVVTLAGGAGGYASIDPHGAGGENDPDLPAAGSGAVGGTPGGPSSPVAVAGGTGGVATVDAEGRITPGDGGAAASFGNYPTAAGGGGYAGGGGGSARFWGQPPMRTAGAGGGGSGYLAPGLTPLSTRPNHGAGYITVTYSFDPTLVPPVSSVEPGAVTTLKVSGLPAATDFAVTLASGEQLAATATDGAGRAEVDIEAPRAEATYVLQLRVAGEVVDEAPLTVAAVAVPPPADPGAEPSAPPAARPGHLVPIAAPTAELPDTGAASMAALLILGSAATVIGTSMVSRVAARRKRRPANSGAS
ncbi:hypothetical protein EHW97_10760 [Aeromicrobium camelliae]|uniref:Gram-positive cocci surface proteins LPxTG domain-containing protein n=1 Tax=Aeromicrobium camelliae TaxID=1538144 RepID=A0A3N6XZL3_9ACTN|nr:hypothetical protein [Aeromicrobium camelliae]RQN03154.1 hypothetical protein EHW97_10760 [Aeromicrobium camelliae]